MAQNTRTLRFSFTAGEITPELFGRLDLDKFQSGLAICRNFAVLPHGPVANRPGTEFLGEVKTPAKRTRLIPFSFNAQQTYAIEFGDGYIRFYTQGGVLLSGGTPYEIASPYAEADLFDLHYVQSADVLTIVHPNYAPRELKRLGAASWTLTTIEFKPTLNAPNPAPTFTYAEGGTATATNRAWHEYVVTAIAQGTLEETTATSPALNATQQNISAITQANPGVLTMSAAHGLAVDQKVYLSGVGGMTSLAGYYIVNTVPSTTTLTLKTLDGAVVDTSALPAYTSGGKLQTAGVLLDLTVDGSFVKLTWNAVANAVRYNVYKLKSGLYGYIGQTNGTSFTDEYIVPDTDSPPPEYYNPFANGAGYWPAAVAYFEQRRAFGGSAQQPQTLWLTKPGSESNFSYSIPTQDDDSISFTMKAREINQVRHIVPLGDMVVLTSGGEWLIGSGDSNAFTPTTVRVRPQSYVGAANVQPEVTESSALYVQAESAHIREVTYNSNGRLQSTDVSLLAPHLFDYYSIADIAFSKGPVPTLWCVRDDGLLLGLTYLPGQQVAAWHQHDTDGAFESVCAISENGESALYCVVRRTINGNTKRYVERLHTRQFATLADAFFVDCGLSYSGPPVSEVSGLSHLEGKTVAILADGAVHPRKVVTAGKVTLEQPASKVHVGLPITADIKTLPMALQIEGFAQGREKNVNKLWLRVYRSSGIFAGPSFDKLREVKQRTTEPYGTPPSLKSDEVDLLIDPAWSNGGEVCLRQSDPLPLTLLSIAMDVAIA